MRNGLPGACHRPQRGGAERAGLQPLRRHAVLRQQLPVQGAAVQLVRLPSRGSTSEPCLQSERHRPVARRDGEVHVLRAAHRGDKNRGAAPGAAARGRRHQDGVPAGVPGGGDRVRRSARSEQPGRRARRSKRAYRVLEELNTSRRCDTSRSSGTIHETCESISSLAISACQSCQARSWEEIPETQFSEEPCNPPGALCSSR